jgi:hypothetical protein
VLREQVVVISARATSFTAVCDACAEVDSIDGWSGSTFGGRLDLDLGHGTFLCRRGHSIRVERDGGRRAESDSGTAAA